jgi:hypothetical protein
VFHNPGITKLMNHDLSNIAKSSHWRKPPLLLSERYTVTVFGSSRAKVYKQTGRWLLWGCDWIHTSSHGPLAEHEPTNGIARSPMRVGGLLTLPWALERSDVRVGIKSCYV